jgi:hypothetical protein
MGMDKAEFFMKKIFLLIFVNILLQSTLLAQVEFKTNALGVLLKKPYLGVEYSFTEDFSMEVGVGAIYGKTINGRLRSGNNMLLAGKYYFDTMRGADRYFVGLYLRPQTLIIKNYEEDNFDNAYRNSGVATGFICGRKWATDSVSLEVNFGLGKFFGESIYLNPNPTNIPLADIDVDIIFNINVGYRFMED